MSTGENARDESTSTRRPVTSRWAGAAEEVPGGVAVLEDGSINTDRFSIGPETELELPWWNKVMTWDVRREPTDHRVVVARTVHPVWRVHIMVAAAVIGLAVFGLVVFGGLSLLLALGMAVVLGLLGYGALVWEQRGSAGTTTEEILEMDTSVWLTLRKKINAECLAFTKEGQQRRYNEAIDAARAIYDAQYTDPKTGKIGKTYSTIEDGVAVTKPVPKFKISDRVKGEFLNKSVQLSPDEAQMKITNLLSPHQQERYQGLLRKKYEERPNRAVNMGRGARDCGCLACAVNADRGVVPPLPGAEAAARRAELAAKRAPAEQTPRDRLTALRESAAAITSGHRPDGKSKAGGPKESRKDRKAREALEAADAAVVAEPELPEGVDEKLTDAPVSEPVTEVLRPRSALFDTDAHSTGDGPMATKPAAKRNRGTLALVSSAAVIGLIVVGLVVMILIRSNHKDPTPMTLPSAPVSSSAPSAPSKPKIPTTPVPAPANGDKVGVPINFGPTDPGNQNTGSGVIAAYDYAYYVTRSAQAALAVYAAGVEQDLVKLQNAIDANPVGTTHSMVITPVVPGKEYDVKLTINWPRQGSQTVSQKFMVTYSEGKFYVLQQVSQ